MTEKSAVRRNLNVEIWRILFCIVIVIYHVGMVFEKNILGVGYLCVEFYFLLSGYGFYRAYVSKRSRNQKLRVWAEYAKNRFLRLYPLYLGAMAAMLAVRLITGETILSRLPEQIRDCAAEFVMLQCSPLGNSVLVLTDWYVATLFWGSLLFMLLLLIGGRVTAWVICPVTALVIYGYYARLIAKIDVIVAHYGFLRALAGIGLGIFLGAVTEAVAGRIGAYGADKTQMKELRKGLRKVLAPAANLLLLGITVYYQFGVRSLWDFVIIGLFFAALLCMLPGENGWLSRFEGPIRRLSGLTYPVYLFQLPVLTLIAYLAGR